MKVREIITILGKTGSGKSHLIKTKLIKKLPKPLIVFDPVNEYDVGIIFHSMNGMIDFIISEQQNNSGIYVFKCKELSQIEKFIKFISCVDEPCTILFEEASMICSPYSIPDSIEELVLMGRHKMINLVFVSQRASKIHRDITAESSCIISFQQTESRDISQLKISFPEAEKLPDLIYNPHRPETNTYMILGTTKYL